MGDTGGEDQVRLSGTQIGNHYHYWSSMYFKNSKSFGLKNISFSNKYLGSSSVNAPFPSGKKIISAVSTNTVGSGSSEAKSLFISSSDFASEKMSYITSLAVGTAAQEAHENRPPYYALYYIMKLE